MRIRPILAVALCAGAAYQLVTPALAVEGLEFQLHLPKKTYLRGEQIVMSWTLTNTTNQPVEAREPLGCAFAVHYTLIGPSSDPADPPGTLRTRTTKKVLLLGGPAWTSSPITLGPHESAESSLEVSYLLPEDYPPGDYRLSASYHPKDYGSEDYLNDCIEAAPVKFTIVDPNEDAEIAAERQEFGRFNPYGQDLEGCAQKIEDFLDRHPRSQYRFVALKLLGDVYWRLKDWRRYVETCRREIGQDSFSSEKRDLARYGAANILVKELHDIAGAVKVLTGGKMQTLKVWREELIKQLPPAAPDRLAQAEKPATPQPASAPQATRTGLVSTWSVAGLAACGLAGVFFLLRRHR